LHSSFRITYVHNYLPTQNVNRLRLQQAIGYLLQCTMHYVPFCLVFVIFFTFFVSRTICVWLCECVASVIAPKRFKRLSAIETLISHSRQVEKLSKSSSNSRISPKNSSYLIFACSVLLLSLFVIESLQHIGYVYRRYQTIEFNESLVMRL